MVNFTFKGFIAPVFSVFNNDKTLSTKNITEYAKFLSGKKIQGILVNGTTGEGVSLNVDERKRIAEAWREATKITKQHLMIQIGGGSLPDVLELARHADSLGVDSLLCYPELYFKPTTNQQLINYLKLVGQAAPNTPLFYYHIPAWSHVNLHMGEFLNSIGDQLPTFKGIKFTSINLEEGFSALHANNGKYTVFLGADSLLAGAFTLGFDSAIATTLNIVPELANEILNAITVESNVKKARNAQEKLNQFISIVTKHGTWVPTMKCAMNYLTPINCGPVREPLENVTENGRKEMEQKLKSYK